ncbi:FAD-dependent monooxygenase [Paenibacillus timonensis]|uniref:FAD-dependent monooxygenase n=1 Tax=Paenibacillus timonensis TaxID=225915 RepID=UPI003F98BFB9
MSQKQSKHAIIVGGSLGGLMMGLVLSRSGFTVTILERAGSSLRNGAFIRLHTKPYRNSEGFNQKIRLINLEELA